MSPFLVTLALIVHLRGAAGRRSGGYFVEKKSFHNLPVLIRIEACNRVKVCVLGSTSTSTVKTTLEFI